MRSNARMFEIGNRERTSEFVASDLPIPHSDFAFCSALASPRLQSATHDALRFSASHADRLRPGQGRIAGRIGRRAGRAAGAGGQRSGHCRSGAHARAALRRSSAPASKSQLFDGVDENPTTDHVDAGVAAGQAIRAGIDRRPGRRQLDGLRQGNQFPLHQRRPDAGLLGRRQSHEADAADDRRAHDRRHRQRNAIVRPDLATPRRT